MKKNSNDLITYGDPNTFELLQEASSESENWAESVKAMEIPGVGCVIWVTSQFSGNLAEALTFVPQVRIIPVDGDPANGRRLIKG